MPWKNTKTQFIRDRMKETLWNDRQYISDLGFIEKAVLLGGPTGWAHAMAYWNQRRQHRLEAECIEKEIKEGVYTSPEEFRRLADEPSRQEELKRQESAIKAQLAERERQAQEEVDRRLWIELGGKP